MKNTNKIKVEVQDRLEYRGVISVTAKQYMSWKRRGFIYDEQKNKIPFVSIPAYKFKITGK